jgi:outer membrane receptor protein involved in Fe transport
MTMSIRRIGTVAGAVVAIVSLAPAVFAPATAQQGTQPSGDSTANSVAPQRSGRIVGRIVDAASGVGLTDVGVQVVGTTIGTQSGVDGRFTLTNVPAGTVTLQARRIGYAAKTVTGLQLAPGQALEQNVALSAAALTLSAQVVTAAAERGTVNEALDQQRTAAGVVNAVTAEQIARSPDGDAAQAVQRVSGVTVQDGRYVFVRGLGERYTQTSLNGARLPSPEPERKVVPLDLFPSGLLQSVTTSKTFTPDQSGDFSGAQVDIKTREFPARRQATFSIMSGFNDAAAGKEIPLPRAVGGELFALAGSGRQLPGFVPGLGNLGTTTQADQNRVINSFRNVWTAERGTGAPNTSISAAFGGDDPVLGRQVGYIASLTYSYNQEVRADQERALARGPVGESYDRFTGSTGRNSVLWGGLLNLSTLLGTHTRLSLNNTYNRTADNDARVERGTLENEGIPVEIQRLDYVQRSVWSSQLAGEHELGRQRIDWAATASGVTRDQPDRSELVYQITTDPATGRERLLWVNAAGEGAVRTFATLDEHSFEGRGNYTLHISAPEAQRSLKFGALARYTDRSADTRAYGTFAPVMSDDERALPPAALFGGAFTAPDSARLRVRALGQGGEYTANDALTAGYAMADWGLSERLRLIGGARVEYSQVEVDAVNTLGQRYPTTRDFTDLLPSLALTFRPTETQNIRLSGSRTLARPEYRELAGITTRDVIGGVLLVGNPNLIRTLIDNADLRWEWYPNTGEVLSVGVFGKRFHDPIERVYQLTSAAAANISFANANSATNYGVELEARKGLGFLAEALEPVSVFTNLTLVKSEIDLGAERRGSTNANRAMVGQAPYVVNGGVTWTSRAGSTSATLLYNRVGERITEAGVLPTPDVKEQPRDVVDFSLRFPIVGAFAGRVDARNLLDTPFTLTQGATTRESYRIGRILQAGVTWRP